MKVAIDSGPLNSGDKIRGIGFHTRELVKELTKLQDDSFRLDLVDFSKKDLNKYDVIHYQSFSPYKINLPFFKPSAKVVLTIHDLIYLIYPKNYPPGIRGTVKFFIQKLNLRNVDAIITISETSKKDIVRFLNINPDKIFVTYLAAQSKILDSSTKEKEKYDLPDKFVLYVGDINYNKNIPNLIKACKIINIPLVIVGKQALEVDEIVNQMNSIKGPRDFFRFLVGRPHPELSHYKEVLKLMDENVIRLGFVDNLDEIFRKSTVYCQPSFYEGFGLPLLEAFERGTAVVASKTQALVEIGQDACLYFDPNDSNDMAEKLRVVIKNKSLASKLVKKGRERVKNFSWKTTAKETLEIYRNV